MKIFIPLICYNHTCNTEFMMCLFRFIMYCVKNQIEVAVHPIVFDSLVNRARNAAVAMFLSDPSATHLLFIDSDIEFQPEDVISLLHSDLPVVGAAYPQKWLDIHRIEGALHIDREHALEMSTKSSVHVLNPSMPSHVMEAEYITTGFLMIQRHVFDKLIKTFPEKQYTNDIDGYMEGKDKFYDFFTIAIHPETRRLESEDYGFCRLWRSTGGKVYVVTNISLKHHGWFGYPGNLFKELQFQNKMKEALKDAA